MILYQVRCTGGHEFEAWFKDSKSFDRQAKKGAVECPECGATKVEKAPMAPRLASGRGGDAPHGTHGVAAAGGELADVPEKAREYRRLMNMMRRQVEENCDYVGDKFAEEARAIHYGEKDPRGIYGEASLKDVKELVDEEIPVLPVPGKPPKDAS